MDSLLNVSLSLSFFLRVSLIGTEAGFLRGTRWDGRKRRAQLTFDGKRQIHAEFVGSILLEDTCRG